MRKSAAVPVLAIALCLGSLLAADPASSGAAAPPAPAATVGGAAGAPHAWHSWQRERTWPGEAGWRYSGIRHLRELDLTASQRSDIQRLIQASFAESAPEWRALRQKRDAFAQATPGTAEYVAARNDLAHAEANAALATVLRRSGLRTKIYAILTPTQRSQLAESEARWRAQRMQRAKASS